MPFPWKKSKTTRISRMVAGLNKTPKRGGSLLVETGFPTSLIDLFVKNRDRLRRSSKRKSDPQIILSDPTRSYPLPPCNQEIQIQSAENTDVREFVTITRDYDDDDDHENKKKKKDKIELHLVFKIFLMVALAVSTRSLAIWIMMVGFLFVGFETFGLRFSGFLKSGSNELLLKRVELERVERELTELIELEDGLKMETILTSQHQGCERSRSARIKSSLIKKFVPKKLRHRNKKNQVKSEKEKQVVVEEEEQEEETESETEVMIIPASDKNDQIPQRIESSEKQKNPSKGDSGYAILFVVVILAGLIGGKGFALLLTLLCCLMIPMYIRTRKGDADLNIGHKTI